MKTRPSSENLNSGSFFIKSIYLLSRVNRNFVTKITHKLHEKNHEKEIINNQYSSWAIPIVKICRFYSDMKKWEFLFFFWWVVSEAIVANLLSKNLSWASGFLKGLSAQVFQKLAQLSWASWASNQLSRKSITVEFLQKNVTKNSSSAQLAQLKEWVSSAQEKILASSARSAQGKALGSSAQLFFQNLQLWLRLSNKQLVDILFRERLIFVLKILIHVRSADLEVIIPSIDEIPRNSLSQLSLLLLLQLNQVTAWT